MFKVLDLFGLGKKFINAIKTFYKKTNISVCLPHSTSQNLELTKVQNKDVQPPFCFCSFLFIEN